MIICIGYSQELAISLDSPQKILHLKVLLVEDEWLLCWSLERHLVRFGIEVNTASTGDEAFRLFEANRYDWLITDLKLPEKDGIELIVAAKKLRPGMRTILMTAYGSPTLEEKARKLGAIYIAKPFDLDLVVHYVLPAPTTQS